jgi:M6 family metalloprotease-like protein
MKKIGLIAVLSVMVCSVWAIPARKGGIVKTQPDGSQITVYQHGDEHFHWMTNDKGEWLKMDADGFYRMTEALSVEQVEARRVASSKRATQAAYPLNIAPRGLVILVNFADVAFETEKAEMDSMLVGENYTRNYSYTYKGKTYKIQSQGSARQYFEDASFGQYNPQFDVVGPVTISKEHSYYGKNDSYGSDMYPDKMVSEACTAADTLFDVDFTQYDNNNDGYVDFVFVIYAGYGEADEGAASTIWPHSWYLSAAGARCEVDGKLVDLYACGNELDNFSKQHTGIGTFCHEFSHVLGLPDLYVTNTATHVTLNEWDIMDYGPYNNEGNTPPAYSSYERFFLGWLTPRLITEPENITLENLNSSNSALIITESDTANLIGNDPNPTTFYMLENRQQEGWDQYLPGHGLMLTKIQYSYSRWAQNTVNNAGSKLGVDLLEANGKATKNGKASDLFPTGSTQYLKIADHPIEQIEETEGVITFKYKGGIPEEGTSVESPQAAQEQILAIYNILGQLQTTTNLLELPHGTYIIKTNQGSKKIVR